MEKTILEELLCKEGLLTPEQLKEAAEERQVTGQKLEQIVIAKGWLREEELNRILADLIGAKTVDLDHYLIEPEAVQALPEEFAHTYKLMPVYKTDKTLGVAMATPTNVFLIDELQRKTGLLIEPILASEAQLGRAITQYYGTASTIKDVIASIDERTLLQGDEQLGEEAPIIRLVNLIIIQAIQERASDVHLEPEDKFLGIRYRIDGILYRCSPIPKSLQNAVISRVKIMAGLDIAEKRLPQDGRILMRVGQKEYDLRVSTNPVMHGENVVLRLLDKSSLVLTLEALGLDPSSLQRAKALLARRHGIILVTGPTGSGKTTTLYALLRLLNKETVNILTVEDPVEYEFPLIRQTQVNPKAGLTFATALRAFLRQDPNIIMVGEIRDVETATLAVHAALTGHLVFSTLHTNDAATAFTRLIDMGVEPFLITSSLVGVIAQRLLRKICDQCKEPYAPPAPLWEERGVLAGTPRDITVYRGRGCVLCSRTGYKGRVGIFEVLHTSPQIQEAVLRRGTTEELKRLAVAEGMTTLRQSAIDKLRAGVTTVEEVLRVTQEIW